MLSREQEENMPTQADYRNMAEECRKKSTLPDASPEWAVLAAKWEGLSRSKGSRQASLQLKRSILRKSMRAGPENQKRLLS